MIRLSGPGVLCSGGRDSMRAEENYSDAAYHSTMNNNESTSKALTNGIRGLIPARYVLVVIGFLGLTNVYLLRVNLNVAIVAMAKPGHLEEESYKECSIEDDGKNATHTRKNGSFDWSSSDQGIILGSFFYGYVITSFLAGAIAERFGGKLVFGLSILITALLTLLTPVAAGYSKWSLVALRVAEGAFEGMSWPAMHTISGRWLPRSERAFLYSIIHTGAEFGTVIGYPMAAALCDSTFLGGWPAAFYIFGAAGVVWFALWWLLVFDSPSVHPRISEEEREYICNHIEDQSGNKESLRTPWFHILTSVPLWSVAFTSFFTHWAFEFIFVDLSSFLDKVLHYNIKTNGGLSSLPHICHVMVQWSGGFLADFIDRRQLLSRTKTRKAMNLFSCLLTAGCFVGAVFSRCDRAKVVALIVVGTGAQGFNVPSFNVALLDMAPRFAGTLMGLANGFGNIGSFAAPMAAGIITEKKTIESWHLAFYIAAGFSVLGGLAFTFFGSSELQSWAKVTQEDRGASSEVEIELATREKVHNET